jgi:hypothetical protein
MERPGRKTGPRPSPSTSLIAGEAKMRPSLNGTPLMEKRLSKFGWVKTKYSRTRSASRKKKEATAILLDANARKTEAGLVLVTAGRSGSGDRI